MEHTIEIGIGQPVEKAKNAIGVGRGRGRPYRPGVMPLPLGKGRGVGFRLGDRKRAGVIPPAILATRQINAQVCLALERLHFPDTEFDFAAKEEITNPPDTPDTPEFEDPWAAAAAAAAKKLADDDAKDKADRAKTFERDAGLPFPLKGNTHRYQKTDELALHSRANLSRIRPTLRAAFHGCILYLRKNEKASSQLLTYPGLTELEVAQLELIAKKKFGLHAIGVQRKTSRQERYLVIYKKSPRPDERDQEKDQAPDPDLSQA